MDRCVCSTCLALQPYMLTRFRSLSNEEVNALQAQVEKRVVQEMALEIR